MPVPCSTGVLIGQIKLTRIHVALLFLPGVRVKRNNKPSLYNVERSGSLTTEVTNNPNFVSLYNTDTFGSRQSPRSTREKWWSLTGSNRRHPACKAGALPAELRPHSWVSRAKGPPTGRQTLAGVLASARPRKSYRTSCGWPGQTRTADLTLIRRAL